MSDKKLVLTEDSDQRKSTPMARGLLDYFPEATATLRADGFTVISPAKKDIEKGIEPDPLGNPIPRKLYNTLLAEDLDIVRNVRTNEWSRHGR